MNDAVPAPDGECPDEETISAFSRGVLRADELAPIEAHIDQCDSCRNVVVELVRIFERDADNAQGEARPEQSGQSGDERYDEELAVTVGSDGNVSGEPPERTLRSGAIVGRYRVLECIGVGGMGVVYSAYDPELDRRVALKLLRGSVDDRGSPGANSRLLREAQALAKLNHPNVITVHDVGTWDEQVVVAMEFIDGCTLKHWLEAPRSWDEVREVFAAAGRGLAAAHAAGLVHRDFKPDNVLLGNDGRVRVTDFGLARWGQPVGSVAADLGTESLPATDLRQSTADSGATPRSYGAEVSMTRSGTMVGTPAYMAPEQYERQPADAASDQFAYCVTLYEAIHGERPFTGRTLAELATNVLEGRLPAHPGGMAVPRSVRQAVRRGLSRRREDRFDSVEALVAVVDARPHRVRWPWAIGIPAAVVGVGVWVVSARDHGGSAFCDATRNLDRTWDTPRKERLRTTFLATGLAYAGGTADKTIAALDAYAQAWEQQRKSTCDPHSRAIDGPTVIALRTGCLERGRLTLGALLEAFDGPDAAMVTGAVGAVSGMPSPERCGERDELLAEAPPPPPPEIADAVEAVRDELARGAGIIAAGRYRDGLVLARKLSEEATQIGHAPLRAETQHLLGMMLDRVGEAEAAVTALEEAELLAIASRYRRLVPKILTTEVYVLGELLRQTDEAMRLGRRAQAELDAADLGDDLRAALLLNLGTVAFRAGKYREAEDYTRDALALQDRDKQPLEWADAVFNLAAMRLIRGDVAAAIEGQQTYIEVFESELGPMHPGVADGYHNLASTYRNAGNFDHAKAAIERTIEIRGSALGPDHPQYGRALASLGSIMMYQGHPEEGMAQMKRGLEILDATELDPVTSATIRIEVGEALVALGRPTEAEPFARQAMDVTEERFGPDHPVIADALVVLAWVAADRKDPAEVNQRMDRADRIWNNSIGEAHEVEHTIVVRARMLAQAGEDGDARRVLDTVWPTLRNEGPLDVRADAARAVAELWADVPERRAEAMQTVRLVIPALKAEGMRHYAEVAQSWLDEQPEGSLPLGTRR